MMKCVNLRQLRLSLFLFIGIALIPVKKFIECNILCAGHREIIADDLLISKIALAHFPLVAAMI